MTVSDLAFQRAVAGGVALSLLLLVVLGGGSGVVMRGRAAWRPAVESTAGVDCVAAVAITQERGDAAQRASGAAGVGHPLGRGGGCGLCEG